MQDLEGILEFAAVAEARGFTRAAARLGISTAQTSRKVSALEARLGTKLLQRTTRTVTVTEPGQIYYEHVRRILDEHAEAERAVTSLSAEPRGKLALTAPVTFGETIVAPLVNEFIASYPELDVTLDLTNQKVDLVTGGYDLAIRLGKLEDSGLVATRMASRTLHICASPSYLTRYSSPLTPSDLGLHNCLLGTLKHWRIQEAGRVRQLRVRGNLRCNSGWALLDAALKGVGIVQLPNFYVETALKEGRLLSLLEEYHAPEEGVWAVYPATRHLSPKVRLLIDHLQRSLRTQAA